MNDRLPYPRSEQVDKNSLPSCNNKVLHLNHDVASPSSTTSVEYTTMYQFGGSGNHGILSSPAKASSSIDFSNKNTSISEGANRKYSESNQSVSIEVAKRRLFTEATRRKSVKERRLFARATPFTTQGRSNSQKSRKIFTISEKLHNLEKMANKICTDHYIRDDTSQIEIESSEEWSAPTLRFLIHNTCSYSVRSLLSFVEQKGSVAEYHKLESCKEVFGPVSLSFLEEVYKHKIPIMSFYNKKGRYPDGDRVEKCIACNKTGGKCECPALDTSIYLFCRQPCVKDKFDCDKCKKWIQISTHLCYDFFFCEICDEEFKSSQKHKPYPPHFASRV